MQFSRTRLSGIVHRLACAVTCGDIAAGLALDGSSPQPIDFLSTVGRMEA
ncbi:hypothetical protein [Streptomyces sp. NPDC051219]